MKPEVSLGYSKTLNVLIVEAFRGGLTDVLDH